MKYQVPNLFIDAWYFNVSGEQASIDIRECQQGFIFIRITFFWFLIHYPEELDKLLTEQLGRELGHVIVEHILGPEDACILCIEAEYKTNTELVQRFLCFRVFRVLVLGKNLVVEYADDFTGLD